MSAPKPRPASSQPNQQRTGTSYAHQNRQSLPGNTSKVENNKTPVRRDFNRASAGKPDLERAKRRQAFMVKRDRPKPVLRPGPHIAAGPDKAAFNTAWEKERRLAGPGKVKSTTAQEVKQRMDAFKQKRASAAPSNTHKKTQTQKR